MNVVPANEDAASVAASSSASAAPAAAEHVKYKNEPNIGEKWGEESAEAKVAPNMKVADDALLGPLKQSATSLASKGRKRKAWKKPEGMPKRPLSAYNLFFKEQRQELLGEELSTAFPVNDQTKRKHRKSHGKVGFQEMASIIGKKWKSLSPEERKVYTDMADVEKAKYKEKVEKWRSGEDDVATVGASLGAAGAAQSQQQPPDQGFASRNQQPNMGAMGNPSYAQFPRLQNRASYGTVASTANTPGEFSSDSGRMATDAAAMAGFPDSASRLAGYSTDSRLGFGGFPESGRYHLNAVNAAGPSTTGGRPDHHSDRYLHSTPRISETAGRFLPHSAPTAGGGGGLSDSERYFSSASLSDSGRLLRGGGGGGGGGGGLSDSRRLISSARGLGDSGRLLSTAPGLSDSGRMMGQSDESEQERLAQLQRLYEQRVQEAAMLKDEMERASHQHRPQQFPVMGTNMDAGPSNLVGKGPSRTSTQPKVLASNRRMSLANSLARPGSQLHHHHHNHHHHQQQQQQHDQQFPNDHSNMFSPGGPSFRQAEEPWQHQLALGNPGGLPQLPPSQPQHQPQASLRDQRAQLLQRALENERALRAEEELKWLLRRQSG